MKTKLKGVHEEQPNDRSRTIGVLLNYSLEDPQWKDTLIFVFDEDRKLYVFFDTIVEMIDYEFYRSNKTRRAYLPEAEYDQYDDSEFIEGSFRSKLKWQ